MAAAGSQSRDAFAEQIIISHGRARRLELTLALGDITQVDASCYVLGLFKAVAPDGAASALDQPMDGRISDLVARRMFGAEAGEISVLPNGRRAMRAPNVAFVGLGSFDSFDPSTLKLACDNLVRTFIAGDLDDFAMVPFGWTWVGDDENEEKKAARSTELVKSMLSGFVRAIEDSDPDYRFRALTICERDPDRFASISKVIHELALTDSFKDLELVIRIVRLPQPPPDTGASAASPATQRIYLMAREEGEGTGDDSSAPLQLSVLTTGDKAAITVDLQPGTSQDLEKLLGQVDTFSALADADATKFGDQLAKLLLTDGVAAALQRHENCHLVVVHDAAASRIPWEALRVGETWPALTGGMSHRYETANLSVAKWLQCRQQSEILAVLLVTNPMNNLQGAEAEGDRIRNLLKGNDRVRLTELRGDAATKDALKAAFSSGEFDMVHYAGHGFFDPQQRGRSGLFCAGGEVLSGLDLAAIDNLPSLMFFNACETARVRGADATLAVPANGAEVVQGGIGFAEALLRGGIANFVGTYWPVHDDTASTFAASFYPQLLNGASLNQALLKSRHDVQQLKQSDAPQDWADYVFYGDPDFQLKAVADHSASSGGDQ